MANSHWEQIAENISMDNNTPQQLWQRACMYFQWCDSNPILTKLLFIKTTLPSPTEGTTPKLQFPA